MNVLTRHTIVGFKHKRFLGSGQFGSVHLYETCAGELRAIKLISSDNAESAKHEATALFRVRESPHKHIIDFFGTHAIEGYDLLVQAYASGGDLFDFSIDHISASGSLPLSAAHRFFTMMCRGVEHLHSLGIAHLDLKLENFMLDSDIVKIVDFGLWHDLQEGLVHKHPYRGSPAYMAPEVYVNIRAGASALVPYDGAAADIWSLAVCLWVMTMGYYPLDERPQASHYEHLAIQQEMAVGAVDALTGLSFIHASYGTARRAALPSTLDHLLDSMLETGPQLRAGIAEVLSSEFVQGAQEPGSNRACSIESFVNPNMEQSQISCATIEVPAAMSSTQEPSYEGACLETTMCTTLGTKCSFMYDGHPGWDSDADLEADEEPVYRSSDLTRRNKPLPLRRQLAEVK